MLGRLSLGLGLALWAVAGRAQTTGAIVGVVTDASTGLPVAGARIAAGGAGLPGEQGAVTGEGGAYRLTFLPPGPYRIAASAEGFLPASRDDVLLRIDKTLRVNLVLTPAQVRLPEETVRSVAPAVDVGKAESAVVVPREAYDLVPLPSRTFESAVALAPSARADGGFDGAQARENGVLVEGLSVADPLDNRLYTALPSNFVDQLDVKTGNYLPEHGRVTGGILSAVTRSGSNEVHGSAFSSILLQRAGAPTGTLGDAIWRRTLGGPDSYLVDAGLELGGPIVRDRLWFHLGIDPSVRRTLTDRYLRMNTLTASGKLVRDQYGNPVMSDLPDTSTRLRDLEVTYRYTGKLTWAPSEDHTFTLATFGSPSDGHGETANGFSTPAYRRPTTTTGMPLDAVARWTGRFAGKRLLADVAVGFHLDDRDLRQPRSNEGVDLYDTPTIRWQPFGPALPLSLFEPVPAACNADPNACRVTGYVTGGGNWVESRVQRLQARAALSWLGRALGAHQVRGGADVEVTRSVVRWHQVAFDYYGGDAAFEAYTAGDVLSSGATSPGDLTYLASVESRGRGSSPALFVQDSWEPLPSLTVNAGLRWEAQDQENSLNHDPRARIRIRDSFAPRAQVIWDPSGQGRSKVSAAWGRYYETIPLSLGTYSFGSTNGFWAAYQASSCPGFVRPGSAPFDPRTCTALVPGWGWDVLGRPATVALVPATTPVAPDLKGQYLDQFGGTLEYEVLSDLTLAVEYQGRRQGRVVEDVSTNDGLSYFIANPGEGSPFAYQYAGLPAAVPLDPRGTVISDPATGRAFTATFPKPERSYDGVTFRATKNWSRRWLVQAGYTWSKLHGNYTGPASGYSNITPQYDLPTLLANQGGLLPNDRTHLVKLFAARGLDLSPRISLTLGAGYTGTSGMPVNATAAHPLYGANSAYLIPRGMAGRTPFLNQLDLRAQLDLAMRPGSVLRVRLDVLNALDSRTVTTVDQRFTRNSALPIAGERCRPVNAVSEPNPAAALMDACPELAFLKTLDGRPAVVNPNYGQPTGFQDPRAFRFGMELTF